MEENNFASTSQEVNVQQPSVQPIQQSVQPQYNYQQSSNNQNKKNSKSKIVAIIVVIALLIIVVLGFSNMMKDKKKIENNTDNNKSSIIEGSFSMKIKGIYFSSTALRITGEIDSGTIALYDEVQISGSDRDPIITTVVRIEKMVINPQDHKGKHINLLTASKGESITLYVRNVEKEDVKEGQIVSRPNSSISGLANNISNKNGSFEMPITNVVWIAGRGTVVEGRINSGKIKKGDSVKVIGLDNQVINTSVTALENYNINDETNHTSEYAEAGDIVALLLKGVKKEDVVIGQVVLGSDTMKSVKKFDADITVLTKGVSGNDKALVSDSKHNFHILTADITGTIAISGNKEKVDLGENAKASISLNTRTAMKNGTEFLIIDDGVAVAKGKVTKIY